MEKFLSSNAFNTGFGIVIIILGIIQIINSIPYIKGILHRGTNNGFALIPMFFAPLVGIVMTIGGIFLLMGAN
ncbi:hypothetical protein [Lactobacillus acetotolerans]|jgi:hypothetical protein|uniref:hypothetical protein n=1 Tax=Lactobacillus acetotolerans TaxID=1600 RepID=UPI00241D98D6|nr:hypothetical protein [Lactobacillus acetotolerans]